MIVYKSMMLFIVYIIDVSFLIVYSNFPDLTIKKHKFVLSFGKVL